MIDIHSHILPGVDDGAADIHQALAMLRLAVAEGVTTQILTPHIEAGRYPNTGASLKKIFNVFATIVKKENIDIKLKLAAEVRIGPEIMQMISDEHMPWLGEWQGANVILLELPHSNVPVGSINIIKWLIKHNVCPVIAHPERNRELQQDISKLKPFVEEGCLLQITASSITGQFGRAAFDTAKLLLENQTATFIATDSHNLQYRPPKLKQGVEAASKLIGEEKSLALVTTHPEQLLNI